MEFDSPPEEVARHHDNLEEVVAQLSTISKQLYYIPGNVSDEIASWYYCIHQIRQVYVLTVF